VLLPCTWRAQDRYACTDTHVRPSSQSAMCGKSLCAYCVRDSVPWMRPRPASKPSSLIIRRNTTVRPLSRPCPALLGLARPRVRKVWQGACRACVSRHRRVVPRHCARPPPPAPLPSRLLLFTVWPDSAREGAEARARVYAVVGEHLGEQRCDGWSGGAAVGYGGLPNSQGFMEMDAAIMDGGAGAAAAKTSQPACNRLGAVCALPDQIRSSRPCRAATPASVRACALPQRRRCSSFMPRRARIECRAPARAGWQPMGVPPGSPSCSLAPASCRSIPPPPPLKLFWRAPFLACSAVAVARAVMDHSPHNVLVGQGALAFARRRGFAAQTSLSPGLLFILRL